MSVQVVLHLGPQVTEQLDVVASQARRAAEPVQALEEDGPVGLVL